MQAFILKLFFAHSYSGMERGPNSLMTVEMHAHVYCAVTDESWVNHWRLASAPHHPRLDDSGGRARSRCVRNVDGRLSLYLECMRGGEMRGGVLGDGGALSLGAVRD